MRYSSVGWVVLGLLLFAIFDRSNRPPKPTELVSQGAIASAKIDDDVGRWRLGWRPIECGESSWIPADSHLVKRCLRPGANASYCALWNRGNTGFCASWKSGEWIDAETKMPRSITARDLEVALADAIRSANAIADPAEELQRSVQDGELRWKPTSLQTIAILERLHRGKQHTRRRIGLFVGDSMLRQLHARLVAHIRDQQPVFEHTSLGEVAYALNSTTDAFNIVPRPQRPKRKGIRPRAVVGKPREPVASSLVRMDFVWAATFAEFPFDTLHGAAAPYADLAFLAHAAMYWTGTDHTAAAADAAAREAGRFVRDLVARSKDRVLIEITTPPREPARTSEATAWNRFLFQRNQAVTDAVRNSSALLVDFWQAVTNGQTLYTGTFASRRKDDKHFMCTFDQKLPATPTVAREDNNGCRDHVNLAIALHALLLVLRVRGF